MSHEGCMRRGKINFDKGLLDNVDTKYYLEQTKPKEEPKEDKPEPEVKKKVRKDDN